LQKHPAPPEITSPVVARPQRGRDNLLALRRGAGERSPCCGRDDGRGLEAGPVDGEAALGQPVLGL
jgi:hypothetical protein